MYNKYYIDIWGNGIEYRYKLSFLIGYASDPIYRTGSPDIKRSGLENFSVRYGRASRERKEDAEKFLKDKKRLQQLASTIYNYIKAKKEFDSIDYCSTPAYYSIKNAFSKEL